MSAEEEREKHQADAHKQRRFHGNTHQLNRGRHREEEEEEGAPRRDTPIETGSKNDNKNLIILSKHRQLGSRSLINPDLSGFPGYLLFEIIELSNISIFYCILFYSRRIQMSDE